MLEGKRRSGENFTNTTGGHIHMYHPLLPSIASITRGHLHILHITERLRMAFPSPPLISFCRPKNLKDLLVWTQLTSARPQTPSNFRCGSPRCKTCPILLTMDVFASHTTQPPANFIILFIWFNAGGVAHLYKGEMGQPLHNRVSGHRFDILHRKTNESPVAAHFTQWRIWPSWS